MTRARSGRTPSERRSGEVVDAARSGEGWAKEELYRRYSARVAAYLRSQSVEDVVGVTNDVFVQVLRGIHRFDGDARAFRSWLFTIAHGAVVDERRRRERRIDLSAASQFDARILGSELMGDVEEDAMAAIGGDVTDLLDHLSADQRDVLLLRVVADLPVEQVAATLGKEPGTVRVLQHRALSNLRRRLTATERLGRPT